jgi:hypothetical protein
MPPLAAHPDTSGHIRNQFSSHSAKTNGGSRVFHLPAEFRPAEIPTAMASVVSSLDRTSVNSPSALMDSFEHSGRNSYYGPPDLGMVGGHQMMGPPMMNMAYDYSSPPHMMPGPPMAWGYQPPMGMQHHEMMGNGQYNPNGNGNGAAMSRSQSHSSSHHGSDVRNQYQGNSTAVYHADPFALQEYIKGYWRAPDFADFTIAFVGDFAALHNDPVPVHALIIKQSPFLSSLIAQPRSHNQPEHTLTIHLTSKFLRAPAIVNAIGFLYGHSLPGQIVPHPSTPSAKGLMSALQHAAAGQLLEIPEIMKYGFHHAIPYLSLSTIELALSYLQWAAESIHHANQAALGTYTARGFTDPLTTFLAGAFPINFTFHRSASELKEASRLPVIQDPLRPSMNNPKLAHIQFGQVPMEESDNMLNNEMVLSSILLSVDTMLLDRLFNEPTLGNRIGWEKVGQHMTDVVAERELRRLKVQKTITGRRDRNWSTRQLETLKWHEYVTVQSTTSGFSVYTRRVDNN